jgi:hypothetical protein
MLHGGNSKYQKIQRKKPKRSDYESENQKQHKTKHHDRSYYRLVKQEKEYGVI